MNLKVETSNFLNDLERVAAVRREIAERLSNIATAINPSELAATAASGKLGLETDSADINLASNNLRQGVFRLLVLGDMKRGKSTFLNALIGENLLPSDVNPCTALLTILRYGSEKNVTVYFNDGKSPKQLDFKSFKQNYTIDPAEAKRLESEKKAEQEMNSAFSQLSKSAANYGASYTKVTEKITEKLTGHKIPAAVSNSNEDNSPAWAKWAMGLFSLTTGNLAGVAMAGAVLIGKISC